MDRIIISGLNNYCSRLTLIMCLNLYNPLKVNKNVHNSVHVDSHIDRHMNIHMTVCIDHIYVHISFNLNVSVEFDAKVHKNFLASRQDFEN